MTIQDNNPCDDESQWQDLCDGDKVLVSMTIDDNYGWALLTLYWEERMMMIDDNYLCDHDNQWQSMTNQWQTQDWGGLVDIVLRGEAALLENKKSGEKHENETSY